MTFWFGVSVGFSLGVAFSVVWVFLWVAIDVAHAAGRKWSWKHGFSKHASYLELERLNAKPDNEASSR